MRIAVHVLATEQDFLTDRPAKVECLTVVALLAFLIDAQSPKQNDVEELLVEPVGIESLPTLKVDDRGEVQKQLDAFDGEPAEYVMVIVQTEVRHIALNFFALILIILVVTLFYFEKALLDFVFDLRAQSTLATDHLHVLAFEVFELSRLCLIPLVVVVDGLFLRQIHMQLRRVVTEHCSLLLRASRQLIDLILQDNLGRNDLG